MTLYSDLEKDMLVFASIHKTQDIQVPQVIKLLCNLIDTKFAELEEQINNIAKEEP